MLLLLLLSLLLLFDHHVLLTDTLVWPGGTGGDKDPFLSVIDPSVVKECITNRYFKVR